MDDLKEKSKPSAQKGGAAVEVEEEEDASTLQFPKEFRNAEPLFISEVLLLLKYRKQMNEKDEDVSISAFKPVVYLRIRIRLLPCKLQFTTGYRTVSRFPQHSRLHNKVCYV